MKKEYGVCIVGACPAIHEGKDSKLYVVGRCLTKEEIKITGLASKVAEDEEVVEVPKKIIEEYATRNQE